MTFGKGKDGNYHWEYSAGYVKGSAGRVWLSCWITMAIIALCFFIAGYATGAYGQVLLIGAAFEAGILLLFFLLWLPFRLAKKHYRYTANETVLAPFSHIPVDMRFNIRFSQVSLLKQRRNDNIIEITAASAPYPMVVAPDDYDAVWKFLLERCPGAATEITTATGQTIRTEMTAERKRSRDGIGFIVFGLIAAVLGFGLAFGWGSRATHLGDYTGTAQATVLGRSSYKSGKNTYYQYQILTEIDGREYPLSVRSVKRKIAVGAIVPITYNVNDPADFVFNSTSDLVRRSTNLITAACVALVGTGAVLTALGIIFIRKNREDAALQT